MPSGSISSRTPAARSLNDVLAQRAQLPGARETQSLVSYRGSPVVRDERATAAAVLLAAGDRAPEAGQLQRPFVGHLCVCMNGSGVVAMSCSVLWLTKRR